MSVKRHPCLLRSPASSEVIAIIVSRLARRLRPRRRNAPPSIAAPCCATPSPAAHCGPDRRGRPNALASVGFCRVQKLAPPTSTAHCGPDRRGRPNALASVGRNLSGAKARSALSQVVCGLIGP